MANKRLDGKMFSIPNDIAIIARQTLSKIPANSQSIGYNSLSNLVNKHDNNTGISYFDLLNWRRRFDKVGTNKQLYLQLGGEPMKKWIDTCIDNSRNIDRKNVQIKRSIGLSEQLDRLEDLELKRLLQLYL